MLLYYCICIFLVCCVFDSVCELFGETIRNMFWCGCYFVLNVIEVFSVGGGALLDIPCIIFQRMCCACDPSVHLSVPSICLVCVFVCRK